MADCLVFAVSYDTEKATKYYLAESAKEVVEYISTDYGSHNLRSITLLGETFDTRASSREAARQEYAAVNEYYAKERALTALMDHIRDLSTQLEAKVGAPPPPAPAIKSALKETEPTR